MKIENLKYLFSFFSIFILIYLLFSITIDLISNDATSFSEVNINKYYIFLLFVFNVLPILFYLFNKNEQELIPLFYFIHIFFLFFYIAPNLFIISELFELIYNRNYENYLGINNTNKVLLVGIFTFNLGYFIFYKVIFIKRKSFEILNITQANEIFTLSLIFMITTVVLFNIIEIQTYKSSFMMLKFPFLFMTLGLICYYLANFYSKKNIFKIIILLLTFTFIILQELLTGLLTFSFLLVFYFFAFFFFCKKRINILLFFGIFFLMLVMQSYKEDYRFTLKNSQLEILELTTGWGPKLVTEGYKTIDEIREAKVEDLMKIDGMTIDVAQSLIRLANEFYSENNWFVRTFLSLSAGEIFMQSFIIKPVTDIRFNSGVMQKKLKTSGSRFFHSFESLNLIVEQTPKNVEFLKGESYKYLIRGLVPGILWKNKPQDNISHDAGIRYGVLWYKDCCTSWNVPIISEMYMNFGTKGVAIGMFIFGFFIRILIFFFSLKNKHNFEYIIGFFCLIPLFYIETTASNLFGSFYKNYILLMVMMFCYRYFLYKPFLVLLKKLK